MEAHLIGAVVIIRAPQGFEAEGIRDPIEKLVPGRRDCYVIALDPRDSAVTTRMDPAEEGRALLASMNIWKDARDATPDG